MRFEVPQFIDIKDKIFGPLTFAQFLYLAGALGLAYVLTRVLGTFWGLVAGAPIVGIAAALAFVKINGQPFIVVMEAAVQYTLGNKLYLWKRRKIKPEIGKVETPPDPHIDPASLVTDSRLHDLAQSLDIMEAPAPPPKPPRP